MALTTKIEPQKLEVPHEAGEWIEVRPLSWKDLERAQEAKEIAGVARAAEIIKATGAEALKSLQGIEQTQAAKSDPRNNFDRGIVLNAAISSWSYTETVTPDEVESLDQLTADWLFERIVELNTRGAEGEA